MPEGVVKRFDAERGSGVIETERGDELFVHRSALVEDGPRELFAGDVVEYRLGRDRRGRPAAVDVRKIGWVEEDDDDTPREWTF